MLLLRNRPNLINIITNLYWHRHFIDFLHHVYKFVTYRLIVAHHGQNFFD
jgi:hypothetical protein